MVNSADVVVSFNFLSFFSFFFFSFFQFTSWTRNKVWEYRSTAGGIEKGNSQREKGNEKKRNSRKLRQRFVEMLLVVFNTKGYI